MTAVGVRAVVEPMCLHRWSQSRGADCRWRWALWDGETLVTHGEAASQAESNRCASVAMSDYLEWSKPVGDVCPSVVTATI